MSPEPAAEDEDDDRDAALLRRLGMAWGRADGGLHRDILLAQLIARHEERIRGLVAWRTYSQKPSVADIDEMVQGVRMGIVKDIGKILEGKVELGAVIGRKVSDEVAEFTRRRERRAGEVSEEALRNVGVDDAPSLEQEAAELRARVAELPERDRVFVSERFFGGLRPEDIARRHGVHRRVVDTATSRALRKLLGSDPLADQRAVRNRDSSSGDRS